MASHSISPVGQGMFAQIRNVAVALPEKVVSNEDICSGIPGWTPEKIEKKLGISSRHVLADDETPVDIAVAAAEKLFLENAGAKDSIDYLIFCTQSPDYILPTSACLIQDRLGLGHDVAAIDINQGCSGYVYGLSLAKAIVSAGLARNVLLLTADSYSKLVGRNDPGTRTIFGDAGTATLISGNSEEGIGPFVFGTDGSGADSLIVRNSGARRDAQGEQADLHMDGPAVLNFTLREVPTMFEALLAKAGMKREDLDFVILHQANKFLLDQLSRRIRDRAGLPAGRIGNVEFDDHRHGHRADRRTLRQVGRRRTACQM